MYARVPNQKHHRVLLPFRILPQIHRLPDEVPLGCRPKLYC